jgi:hypothetical protein
VESLTVFRDNKPRDRRVGPKSVISPDKQACRQLAPIAKARFEENLIWKTRIALKAKVDVRDRWTLADFPGCIRFQ